MRCFAVPPAQRRATPRSPPTATARRPLPTSPQQLAGERIEPAASAERGPRRRRRLRRVDLRGSRRAAGAAGARLPGPGPGGRAGTADRDRRAPAASGTINHTLLTIEAARRVGLERRGGRADALARATGPHRALKSRDDRLARRGQRRDAGRALDLASPDSWPALCGSRPTRGRPTAEPAGSTTASASSPPRAVPSFGPDRGETDQRAEQGDYPRDAHRVAEGVDKCFLTRRGGLFGLRRARAPSRRR